MKTVFITGSSTGIGYECAKIFMENGWNVVATMRNPQNAPDSLKQRIAESRKRKMQYVVGKSTEIVALSKILPDKMVRTIIKKTMMK